MKTADEWISTLQLQEHPEGGYYRETYRSKSVIPSSVLSPDFDGDRNSSTAIYFLLPSHHKSLFHKIKSDELWHFHAGSCLSIYILDRNGITILKLGDNTDNGESLQHIVPANVWFGAQVHQANSFCLCSCTVSPGFDFRDFELARRDVLEREFPSFKNEIKLLTKG